MTSGRLRWVLVAVIAVALVEWVAAARAYTNSVGADDWTAFGQRVDSLPPDEPVVFADDWLAPRARMASSPLARLEAAALPDLREPTRIHVLGWRGRAWSDALQADLEDRPAPHPESTLEFGDLTLTTYAWPDAAVPTASMVDDLMALSVESDGGRCRGKRTFKCAEGRVVPRVVEVDYRARRCLEIDVSDGATVRVLYRDMPLGTVLRGHVGWGDFNHRLRSDAPANIELSIDGHVHARWLASDTQGWRPLAVATTPGTANVEVAITPALQRTWSRDGYGARAPHPVCFELRALQDGARGEAQSP